LVAVLDTGAQRGATGTPTGILSPTGTALNIQPAVGKAKRMTGILMGAETVDQRGNSFILVVPDVSVYDPGMSDSVISAGRLTKAGYNVNSCMASPGVPFPFTEVAEGGEGYLTENGNLALYHES